MQQEALQVGFSYKCVSKLYQVFWRPVFKQKLYSQGSEYCCVVADFYSW